ncbi:unnamed protein product [Laminaria digitata]
MISQGMITSPVLRNMPQSQAGTSEMLCEGIVSKATLPWLPTFNCVSQHPAANMLGTRPFRARQGLLWPYYTGFRVGRRSVNGVKPRSPSTFVQQCFVSPLV